MQRAEPPVLKAAAFQPPDAAERSRALDPSRSFLVQAPAGSGKTYLLTQRFLRLLGEVESPDEIIAITFTIAAAAEMRNRVLEALEKAAKEPPSAADDPESMAALAARVLARSQQRGWQLLEQSGQLRIMTIDAFCRSLALQSPLSWGPLSGLGGQLEMAEDPALLYRLAARRTIESLGLEDTPARRSVEALLLWRDNNWKDVEDLIGEMLKARSRWFQDFVFERETDWEALRLRLEAPFRRAARRKLETLGRMLDRLEGSREFAMALAHFACRVPGKSSPLELAELAELPVIFSPEAGEDEALLLEDAVSVYGCLAKFLLTKEGEWRSAKGLNATIGFPSKPDSSREKTRFGDLVAAFAEEPGLKEALVAFCGTMPVRYTNAEWDLVRACFVVLREAYGQLQVVFAETGTADFTEVAQIALRILAPENGFPSDLAMRQADGIRHLLIDEFQDTSRAQHELLTRLVAAWPGREGRSCFCVGDPMQSIYGFREAEVELFERLKKRGLETGGEPGDEPFLFDFVALRANFRTVPSLVEDLNRRFEQIFDPDDASGVRFSVAEAARESASQAQTELHLAFTRDPKSNSGASNAGPGDAEATRQSQLAEMVTLIGSKLEEARDRGASRFRVAVLARARKSLVAVAEALRDAGIAFRAVDLVPLRERTEVLDALMLARALLNPVDRTAWLGVLRAPWCGLNLEELHLLTSADDPQVASVPVPQLLETRLPRLTREELLSPRAAAAAGRVAEILRNAAAVRSSASSVALGTWLESVWIALGGGETVDAEQQENLRVLWSTLDGLREGEVDLLGSGLDAALDGLFAQPDPAASAQFGVQLMTIHKSKGLEFEVVMVPDLEARENQSQREMIVWLERGLAEDAANERHASEFLVAPIQAKGTEAGAAKSWVASVKRERERQELRRLLYVAATRAREELHLFARPKFRLGSAGQPMLAECQGLLATAWPALQEEVEAQFAAWADGIQTSRKRAGAAIPALAAEAEENGSNVIEMPLAILAARPTMMRRLPEGYSAPALRRFRGASSDTGAGAGLFSETRRDFEPLYARTEGGLESRALGTAIHTLLEQLSRLRRSMAPAEAAEAVTDSLPSITATLRGLGLTRPEAERLAGEALEVAQRTSRHPIGAWILSPHPRAESEARWTGLSGQSLADKSGSGGPASELRSLRADRVFFAAAESFLFPAPGESAASATEPVWWIIDYKTSHAAGADLSVEVERSAFLRAHREQHAGQLDLYARILRHLHESQDGQPLRIRGGLFYPRLDLLDSWEA